MEDSRDLEGNQSASFMCVYFLKKKHFSDVRQLQKYPQIDKPRLPEYYFNPVLRTLLTSPRRHSIVRSRSSYLLCLSIKSYQFRTYLKMHKIFNCFYNFCRVLLRLMNSIWDDNCFENIQTELWFILRNRLKTTPTWELVSY